MRSVTFAPLVLLLYCLLAHSFALEQLRVLDLSTSNDDLGLGMTTFNSSYPNSLQHPELASTKDFHGTQIVDKFAWLEDPTSPSVKAWVDAQNEVTESFLKQLEYGPKITARYVLSCFIALMGLQELDFTNIVHILRFEARKTDFFASSFLH